MRNLPGVAMLAALIVVAVIAPPTSAQTKLPRPTTATVQPGTNAVLECPLHGPGYSFGVRQNGRKLSARDIGHGELKFGREAYVWTFKNGATFAVVGKHAVQVTFWCAP